MTEKSEKTGKTEIIVYYLEFQYGVANRRDQAVIVTDRPELQRRSGRSAVGRHFVDDLAIPAQGERGWPMLSLSLRVPAWR